MKWLNVPGCGDIEEGVLESEELVFSGDRHVWVFESRYKLG